jgi:hypothetical protein
MSCSHCEKLQAKINKKGSTIDWGDECPIHGYDGLTVPGPHKVIKFMDKIYASTNSELYVFDQATTVWSKVNFPRGLAATADGGLTITPDAYTTIKKKCSCDPHILFSKGCQCGGI